MPCQPSGDCVVEKPTEDSEAAAVAAGQGRSGNLISQVSRVTESEYLEHLQFLHLLLRRKRCELRHLLDHVLHERVIMILQY